LRLRAVIVVVVNFGGATPMWRWGGRAIAGMRQRLEERRRRRMTRWCWRGMDPTINIIFMLPPTLPRALLIFEIF
jgi:hypothetical protein